MLVTESYYNTKNNLERYNFSPLGSMAQFMQSLKIKPNSTILQTMKLHFNKIYIYYYYMAMNSQRLEVMRNKRSSIIKTWLEQHIYCIINF